MADPSIAHIPHRHFVHVNLLEVGGTPSAAADLNLDCFWHNARTYTLDDPVHWKYQHLGCALLHDTPPPLRGVP